MSACGGVISEDFSASSNQLPLTTIFTPPSDCFTSLPSYWTSCIPGPDHTPNCFWSNPATCFPSGGQTFTGELHYGFVCESSAAAVTSQMNPVVTQRIVYWPGVLPSGWTGVSTNTNDLRTVIQGCRSGWKPYTNFYCTSDAIVSYSVPLFNHSSGTIFAIMPQIHAAFEASDLAKFTPASAPVLPTAALASYEHSVSRSKAAARTRPPSTLATATHTRTSPTHTHNPEPSGLSTGAKAGIGVGVAVAVLACIVIAFLVLRRKRRSPKNARVEIQNAPVDHETKGPSELGDRNAKSELPGHEPPEVEGDASKPPPIPYASKPQVSPRGRSELEGSFGGHEVIGVRSPVEAA